MNTLLNKSQSGTATLPFQVGGRLRPDRLYVVRSADRELVENLLRHEFCYVLATRQIGKSSLMGHAIEKLKTDGVKCVILDLQSIGSEYVSENNWYFGLAQELAAALQLEDATDFWERYPHASPVYRFKCYLYDTMKKCQHDIVIFVDEIDAVLSLPFPRDDFFSLIRGIHHARVDEPCLERLSFCLLGVATPSDLIRDHTRTPFNIGREIRLNDFTAEESEQFLPALSHIADEPQMVLERIYWWTCGHPYMMQRLCEALTNSPLVNASAVDHLVDELFLRRGRTSDHNLMRAEQCFDVKSLKSAQMLALYRRLLDGEIVRLNFDNPIHAALRLSGMAAERQAAIGGTCLGVRNPIFATVFDAEWVDAQQACRQLAEPLRSWLNSGRNPDKLLRGPILESIWKWSTSKTRQDVPTPEELDYLRESLEAYNRVEEASRVAHTRRIRTVLFSIAGTFMLGALLIAAWQFWKLKQEKQSSEQAWRLSEENALAQMGLRAKILAKQPGNELEAVALGLHAVVTSLRQGKQPVAQAFDGLYSAADAVTLSAPLRDDSVAGRFQTAAFSSDGRHILTTHTDGIARVWDARTHRLLFPVAMKHAGASALDLGKDISSVGAWYVYQNRRSNITLARFSPDGRNIVTGNDDGTLAIYDAQTGLRKISIFVSDEIKDISFSPDSREILVSFQWGKDGRLLLDSYTGKILQMSSHAFPYQHPSDFKAFSADGSRVVTMTDWRSLTTEVLDRKTRSHLLTVAQWTLPRSIALSPNGDYCAASYMPIPGAILAPWQRPTPQDSGQTVIWNIETKKPRSSSNHLESLVFSPDGRLVMGIRRRTVEILHAFNAETFLILDHSAELLSAKFSNDGKYVLAVTGERYDTIWLWDVRSGRLLFRLPTSATQGDLSPDGSQIVSVGQDGTARVWNLVTGRLSRQLLIDPSEMVALFSPDPGKVALAESANNEDSIKILDIDANVQVQKIKLHLGPACLLKYSPDVTRLVVAYKSGVSHILDSRTGQPLILLSTENHTRSSTCMTIFAAFLSDGRRIVTVSDGDEVNVWDVNSGRLLASTLLRSRENGFIFGVSYDLSPQGDFLLARRTGRLLLVNLVDGDVMTLYEPLPSANLTCAAYSPDGRRIVVGQADGRVFVLEGGHQTLVLVGHRDNVTSARFSIDGRRIITTSIDRSTRVWDAITGKLIVDIDTPSYAVGGGSFSSDGRHILSLGNGGILRIDNISEDNVISFACNFVGHRWYLQPPSGEALDVWEFCEKKSNRISLKK